MQNNYNLEKILENFLLEINKVNNLLDTSVIKTKYLGRNGIINKTIENIKNIDKNLKKQYGILINEIKIKIKTKIDEKLLSFENFYKKEENIDISIPGINESYASEHIITKTINEIETYFVNQNFELINGKELDNQYFNFDALNIKRSHPSRSKNETFYINDKMLLRTHTSNMQIHAMKKRELPLKIISHGKVFRRDSDISHTPMFHQFEGFIVDEKITVANLKFTILNFLNFFFKKKIKINMRSSYFPFTEPSMEVDIECINCLGKKCDLCKQSGWIEILGCGMIHPEVLKNCNIDNKKYNGLAFGIGIERITMIRYKIKDIRLFFENNIEFLNQF